MVPENRNYPDTQPSTSSSQAPPPHQGTTQAPTSASIQKRSHEESSKDLDSNALIEIQMSRLRERLQKQENMLQQEINLIQSKPFNIRVRNNPAYAYKHSISTTELTRTSSLDRLCLLDNFAQQMDSLRNKLVLSEKAKISKLLDYDQLPKQIRCVKKDFKNDSKVQKMNTLIDDPGMGIKHTKELQELPPANFFRPQRKCVEIHPLQPVISDDPESNKKEPVTFSHMSLGFMTQRSIRFLILHH